MSAQDDGDGPPVLTATRIREMAQDPRVQNAVRYHPLVPPLSQTDADLRQAITLFGVHTVEDEDWVKITPEQRAQVRRLMSLRWKVAAVTDEHVAMYGEIFGSTLVYRDGSLSHNF